MRMNKQALLAFVLTMALGFGGLAAACAQTAPAAYQVGDTAADFTVTLSDGRETSLYGLLQEKKAVLLNFWASWCGPCQMEFPYLQEAYDQLGADVGMIALSIHDGDTNEAIEAFKKKLGLSTLPMGRDTGLAEQYGVAAYPTSVFIDRNGVICLIHEGVIRSTRLLTNALEPYIGDDYGAPLLLDELPPLPVTMAGGAEALSAAMNAPGGELEFVSMESEEELWPFVPSEDGSYAVASNADVQGSLANVALETDVKAGDVLVYDFQLTGADYEDRLAVLVDGSPVALHTGTLAWTTAAFRFEAGGTRQVAFAYARGRQAGYAAACALRGVRLLTGEAAAAYEFPASTAPKTLAGTELLIDLPPNARKVQIVDQNGASGDQQPLLYVLNADTAALKLRIGADVDDRFAAVTVISDMLNEKTTMLNSLEHDDEGYFLSVDLSQSSTGATTYLKRNVLTADAPNVSAVLCPNEESAKTFLYSLFSLVMGNMTPDQLDEVGFFALAYEDGSVFYTSDELFAALKKGAEAAQGTEAAADAAPVFTVVFTDEAGQPVPNVMAQFCDDATCTVLPSDETGTVRFEGENHAYDLHVLMVPAGYQAPEETVALPETGGELTIVLKPLLP